MWNRDHFPLTQVVWIMQWLNVVSSHPMESSAVHTAGLDVHFNTFLLGVPPDPRIRVCLAFTEYSSYGLRYICCGINLNRWQISTYSRRDTLH